MKVLWEFPHLAVIPDVIIWEDDNGEVNCSVVDDPAGKNDKSNTAYSNVGPPQTMRIRT